MLKRLKRYFKSTFVRYIVSYLLLMALLVGGLTVYMYSYYRSSVYDSTINAETSYAWQLKYRADAYADKLVNLSRLIEALPSDAGSISGALSEAEKYADESIFVYSRTYERVYSSEGQFNAEGWLSGYDYEDLTQSELKDELFYPEGFTIIKTQNVTANGDLKRLLTISVPAGRNMTVISMLPEDRLLDPADGESGSNRYIIYNSVICARSETFSVNDTKVLEAGSLVQRAVTEIKNLQGVNYLFIAIPGGQDGIVYVSAQPLKGIRAKAAGVWLGFMAVLMSLALPCTLFMVYISRKNLAPILEIGEHFGRGDSKYSDEISAIVSGIEELEGQNKVILTSSISARRHIFAKDLVSGAFESAEQAESAGRELGIDTTKRCLSVMLVGAPKERRQELYVDGLIDLTPEGVSAAGTDLVESSQSMLICFADDPESLRAYALKILGESMIRTLRLPVALSAVHFSLSELSAAYLEATSAYESRFFMGDNRLLEFSELPINAGNVDASAEDHAREIKNALSEGDMALVDKCLERLRETLSSEKMNLFSFRKVYNDVIGAIMSEAALESYSSADIYDLFSLSDCRSVEELEQVLRGVCEKIIASKNPEDKLPLIRRVIAIMTVNYTDSDFTLTQAAELSGITPTRLSGEFKTKMGMTPMDYLTMLRMEEAKRLLRTTDLPISDVCRQSGYADASSFTRRFKQYAGTTPLQYRQAAKNEKQDGKG